MRIAIIYFFTDGTIFTVSSPLVTPTGSGGTYLPADFDSSVKVNWPQGAGSAVCYQNATTAQAYASQPQ